jgi:lysyl-tRNA synthetase class 2
MRRRHQFQLIQALRQFFQEKGFLETLTPPLVQNPGMETHIHPFQAFSVREGQKRELYLHTSPEFCLKELLADHEAEGLSQIYNLSYCFRDEPTSPIHRPQFLMLEWYRLNMRYEAIMEDVEELLTWCITKTPAPLRTEIKNQKLQRLTMEELWLETIKRSPLDFLNATELRSLIVKDFPEVPLPTVDLAWDDLFFLLHLNKVEPELHRWPLLLVKEFPAPLAALSTLKSSDKRVCERFEVYVNGIELCNAYNELTDPVEQRRRFKEQAQEKKSLYNYQLPAPEIFLESLDRGLPPSAGIALGVERLLHSLFEVENPFFY